MTQTVQALLPSATALVFAGSMAPGYPAGYPAHLASMARKSGVPVLLDVQGPVLLDTLAARPAVVKINLAEFAATFLPGRLSGGEHGGVVAEALVSADIMNAVSEVSRDHATSFVLTRGAESILLARDGDVRSRPVPALPAEQIINPIGSGDAFLAGMLAQLLTSCSNPDWDNLPLGQLTAGGSGKSHRPGDGLRSVKCTNRSPRTHRGFFRNVAVVEIDAGSRLRKVRR